MLEPIVRVAERANGYLELQKLLEQKVYNLAVASYSETYSKELANEFVARVAGEVRQGNASNAVRTAYYSVLYNAL